VPAQREGEEGSTLSAAAAAVRVQGAYRGRRARVCARQLILANGDVFDFTRKPVSLVNVLRTIEEDIDESGANEAILASSSKRSSPTNKDHSAPLDACLDWTEFVALETAQLDAAMHTSMADCRKLLEERLHDNHLRLEEVNRAGHCLFDALAKQLNARFPDSIPSGVRPLSYADVRRAAAHWLRGNADYPVGQDGSKLRLCEFLESTDGANWPIFCDNVQGVGNHRPDPLWGNHIVLIALAEVYKRPIRVWTSSPGDRWWTLIAPQDDTASMLPVELAHEFERHYLSVVPIVQPQATILHNSQAIGPLVSSRPHLDEGVTPCYDL